MPYPAPAKQKTSATIPCKKITTSGIGSIGSGIEHILHLPGGQLIITYSEHGSFRVWDLETGAQVGDEWEDKEIGIEAIALSPDSKTLASGSRDGAVRLWNTDTGKIIKKWTGHTGGVGSVCWSPDGGRVVSGSWQRGTFIVWDVKSGRRILGPITAGESMCMVGYSPNAKMISTCGDGLKVWDASTGKLLTTIIEGIITCLAWTSDGKTLMAGAYRSIIKFDTATWFKTAVLELEEREIVCSILLSPDERILASTSIHKETVQLWNLRTNQSIGPPLLHESDVTCTAFSADAMFLTTGCRKSDSIMGDPIYIWDLSAIVKDASLLSKNVDSDATRRPASKIKVASPPSRRIPPGFFDDVRHADLSTSHTQSHGQHDSRTPSPRQRTFPSFWRHHFNRHEATERGTQPWPSPFSWTRSLGVVRRRDAQDIKLREPPIVDVPCTAGQPRNYHARRKKPTASSSQRAYAHPIQQPPPTATASTLPAVPAVASAAGTAGTITHPHIAFTGWRARLMAWVCCMPIQNSN